MNTAKFRIIIFSLILFSACQADNIKNEFLRHFLQFSSDTTYEKEHTYDTLTTIYFNDFDEPLDTIRHFNKTEYKGLPWDYLNSTWNMTIMFDGENNKAEVKYHGSGGLLMYLKFKLINEKWYLIEYQDIST